MKLSDKIRASIMRIAKASAEFNKLGDDEVMANHELADSQLQFEELMMKVDMHEEAFDKRASRVVTKQRLHTAINRYVEAKVADSWKGSGPPVYIPTVADELRRSRLALDAIINELFKKDDK